jgi:diguanylate cyclase (GGDEF)-like protein
MLQVKLEMTDINDNPNPSDVQNRHQAIHHTGDFANVDERSLLLSRVLQSTLELSKVLELFSDEISAIVPYNGLSYDNDEESFSIRFGDEAQHRCSYTLTLLDKSIGNLVFYREQEFLEGELALLETMIAALIYPLRNAILYKRAIEKAHKDTVTGVSNRTAMDTNLYQEVDLAGRHSQNLSLILLDIDRFKQINDTYGHIAGDTILKRVAESMSETVRGSDIIYRFGGEEFVVVLRSTNHEGAMLLAERIRADVELMHVKYDDLSIQVTLSAGVSSYQSEDTTKSLLERCDSAMYQAKENGRNQVVSG